VLADGGGADAPREWSARLSEMLGAELERGARELREPRTGYPDPIVAALAAADGAILAALPLPVELRADPDVVSERGGALAAAAVEALVEASRSGPPASSVDLRLQAGDLDGRLARRYPAAEPAETAEVLALARGREAAFGGWRAPGARLTLRGSGGAGRAGAG
jgi:hypothetical protein